jgi:hypothetical protein
MEKGDVKLVIFNGEDFGYWKNRTCNYLLCQRRIIWEIVQEAYVIPATLDNIIQGELQMYENNYKVLNLITTALGKNVYDRVSHLKLLTMFGLRCAIPMRDLLRLSLPVRIRIICNIRLLLRNLVNHWMTALLILSLLSIAYVLVVLLHTLTMNVLSSCYMCLMIMFGA